MSAQIKPTRVRAAIDTLFRWSSDVNTQNSQHLFPLLALIEKRVNSKDYVNFEESDDFAFWDRYARLPADDRPNRQGKGYTDNYYIDPLTRLTRKADHPHRSPSTFRKRTFANSWNAANFKDEDDKTYWKLSENFSEIFERKVLSKARVVTKIPVVDLSVYLFRDKEFSESADAKSLEAYFRETFPFSDTEFERLFDFRFEESETIFTTGEPSALEYRGEIDKALRRQNQDGGVESNTSNTVDDEMILADDDSRLLEVTDLLSLGTSGIILRGCPGTGKSWYATQIARILVRGDMQRVFRVQFHPSFGYEDFVEGYSPAEHSKSGFTVVDKVFLQACDTAKRVPLESNVVFIIDEINRGDPARIFGEILTYIERGYRDVEFVLPYSGRRMSIPKNLLILGTMNHHDRSIVQLDQAFLRRFDHIDLLPDGEMVSQFLEKGGEFSEPQTTLIVEWYDTIQKQIETGIGHTYFKDVRKLEDLQTVWRYRIHPYCAAQLELDPQSLANIEKMFSSMYDKVSQHQQLKS